LILEKKHSPVD